jgi:hypothetical protein
LRTRNTRSPIAFALLASFLVGNDRIVAEEAAKLLDDRVGERERVRGLFAPMCSLGLGEVRSSMGITIESEPRCPTAIKNCAVAFVDQLHKALTQGLANFVKLGAGGLWRTAEHDTSLVSKYPPARPGALIGEPLKAAAGSLTRPR